MRAVRRMGERQAQWCRNGRLEDLAGLRRRSTQRAPNQIRGIDVAENDVGIGDRRLCAAQIVTDGPGKAPALCGPTCSEPPASIQTMEPPPAPTSARSIAGTLSMYPAPVSSREIRSSCRRPPDIQATAPLRPPPRSTLSRWSLPYRR